MLKKLTTKSLPNRYVKIILFAIAVLISLDATLLFAAQQAETSEDSTKQLQQIQQLQQMAQAEDGGGSPTNGGGIPNLSSTPSSSSLPVNQQPVLPNQQNPAAGMDGASPIPMQNQMTNGALNGSATNIPQMQGNMPLLPSQQQQVNMQQQNLNGMNMTNPSPQAAYNQPNPVPALGMEQNTGNMQQPQQMVVADPQAMMRERAFNSIVQNMMPLSPDQIRRLHQQFDNNQYASQVDTGSTPPRPVASSKVVSLAPGATPPVIRLSQGFVSSLVFVDSTGAPWPIRSYDLGNPGAFNIQWDKQSNTLMIQAIRQYTYGNLAVQLAGLPTPVMITLVPGQKAVDYRADLRIQGVGPNAKALPIGNNLPGAASSVLLGVLDGVPPPGARNYTVVGGNAQAWLKGNKLYLRTRMTVLSPGWIATMTSADGTKAYELPQTPMLLVSDNGKVIQLKIEGL